MSDDWPHNEKCRVDYLTILHRNEIISPHTFFNAGFPLCGSRTIKANTHPFGICKQVCKLKKTLGCLEWVIQHLWKQNYKSLMLWVEIYSLDATRIYKQCLIVIRGHFRTVISPFQTTFRWKMFPGLRLNGNLLLGRNHWQNMGCGYSVTGIGY